MIDTPPTPKRRRWQWLVVCAAVCASRVAFAGEVEVAGKAVDIHNIPIANARVYWAIEPTLHSTAEQIRTVEGTTNDEGEFRLRVDDHPLTAGPLTDQLWVHSTEHRISVAPAETMKVRGGGKPPVRLVLLPPEETSFRILDPEGHILEGQLVEPRLMEACGPDTIPQPLSQALGQLSNADGIVTFRSISVKELEQVRVVTEKFGTQTQSCYVIQQPKVRTIQLQNPVRVPGLVDPGSEGRWDKRVNIVISSQLREAVDQGVPPTGLSGATKTYASVTADDQGRFSIETIADGILRYGATAPPDIAFLPDLIQGNTTDVRPSEIRIKFAPTVPVAGTVVDVDTRAAVEGATVFLDSGVVTMTTVTDEKGQYRARVLPGPLNVSVPCRTACGDIRMPAQFTRIGPETASEPVALSQIAIPKLHEISGEAVNSAGAPLFAAAVVAYSEGTLIGHGYVDADSHFQLFILPRPHLSRINLFKDGIARSCNLVEEPRARLTLE